MVNLERLEDNITYITKGGYSPPFNYVADTNFQAIEVRKAKEVLLNLLIDFEK